MSRRKRKRRRQRAKNQTTHTGIAFFGVVLFILALMFILTDQLTDYFTRNTYDVLEDVPYSSLIQKKAKEYDLSPYLVAAVIKQESYFDPKAVSRVGASGLMQVMPETGEYIAEKRGLDFHPDDLFNPKINVDFGCWYLANLRDRFDSEWRTVLSAYNAGPSVTEKWLENDDYSKDGKTLTYIPYRETAIYVERVMKYYEVFIEHKGEESADT